MLWKTEHAYTSVTTHGAPTHSASFDGICIGRTKVEQTKAVITMRSLTEKIQEITETSSRIKWVFYSWKTKWMKLSMGWSPNCVFLSFISRSSKTRKAFAVRSDQLDSQHPLSHVDNSQLESGKFPDACKMNVGRQHYVKGRNQKHLKHLLSWTLMDRICKTITAGACSAKQKLEIETKRQENLTKFLSQPYI